MSQDNYEKYRDNEYNPRAYAVLPGGVGQNNLHRNNNNPYRNNNNPRVATVNSGPDAGNLIGADVDALAKEFKRSINVGPY